jgi:hypothetical protein
VRRGYVLVAAGLAAGLLLQGCATKPVVYGPIGPEVPYGYKDLQNPDGGFTVLVAMPGLSQPAELRAFFDRRAGELCPSGVERTNVFRMQHDDETYVNYGSQYPSVAPRVWTGAELEGYVYCKPGAGASKSAAP